MQPIRPLLAAILLVACALPAAAQTIKTLGYNTTNGQVVYSGTNTLTFTNTVLFGDDVSGSAFESSSGTNSTRLDDGGISFGGSASTTTRINLGFSTNLNTFWTATNSSNARSAVGLGATWLTNTNVTNFRSDVGLPLAALTNTSNVTMMRALANTTNTNALVSGVFQLTNVISITVSNGIILAIEEP